MILASWLAPGVVYVPAQERLSPAEDPCFLRGLTGSITTNFFWAIIDQLNDFPGQDPPGFTIQWDKIQGVSADLVVRPFQFKDIASTSRNFVRDACNFHFGMEPREMNPGFDTPSENHDSDNDGIPDVLSLGDVRP